MIVQTLAPEAPSIASAAKHDANGFLAAELERRRALRYPPFSHLVAINLAAEQPQALDRVANRIGELVRRSVPAGTDVLGPAALFKLRGRERRRLLLKAGRRDETVGAVRAAIERLGSERALRGVALGVDVDPQ